METDSDPLALPDYDDLDIDLSLPTDNATGVAATDEQIRDSMLELEQALEEETRDITSRFQNEKRPEPAGLDRALGDNHSNSRQQRPSGDAYAQQKYANKSGGFITGFDPLSKEEIAKKANRAQRFGALPQADAPPKSDANMDEGGMDVDMDEGEWTSSTTLPEPPRTATIRLEAVHLYGTDEMSTKDVLKYFEAYGPSHVEWIDDSSCNVVFKDNFSAKRALYYQLVDSNVNFGEDEDMNDTTTDLNTAGTATMTQTSDGTPAMEIPRSKNLLRRAKDYIPVQQRDEFQVIRKNTGIYLRYATDYDHKQRGAAARSTYYAIHGREEARSGGSLSGSSRYGRRSRADEDEVWNRGRGISTLSGLRRKMERGSQSPSPTRHRSWSRNRRLAGSRSRSRSRSRSSSRGRSRSPIHSSRRERGSRSPDSGNRSRPDDYERRGRRGDISLRLGGRINFPEDDAEAEAAVESRLNRYADDFLQELESTFSRREKAIPKTKMYSDYYEREIVTEKPTETYGNGRGRNRDRDKDRRDDSALHTGGRGGDNKRRGGHRGRDREEALRAIDARLGLPAEDQRVDEFGRTWRD
ncbi:hypothetical protein BGZ50_007638 [Haplosporangium sp. Z 11]|nr:hypothetical protein BGZ50_007638 [Haplosporangium sp. Z 11]